MLGLKKIGEAHGEFNVFEPLKVNEPEEYGNSDYSGPALPHIPIAGMGKGKAAAGLEEKLKRLINSAWLRAKPKDGAERGNAIAGSHRVAHNMPPLPAVPGGMPALPMAPGQRGIAGMASHYRAVQPVGFPSVQQKLDVERETIRLYGKLPPGMKPIGKSLDHLMSEVPSDFSLMRTLPVVSAYAFRGDRRNPTEIERANGFQSPFSRKDEGYMTGTVFPTFAAYLRAKIGYTLTQAEFTELLKGAMPDPEDRKIFAFYEMWRGQVAAESMHVGRMVANEALKGYVSTTRAPTVAKGYAKPGGYVYYVKVRSGFLIPSKGAHPWTHIFGEEEIASPNPIAWAEVVGFRAVGNGNRFTGPIFMRKGFNAGDANGFEKGIRALSGKHRI